MIKEEKHSGQVWCNLLNITITNPKGWFSVDEFNHVLIIREEFINRASSSDVKPILNATRRNAKKMLNRI